MQYRCVRVVTRNFIFDFWSSIQNIFGQRLSKYEEMINNAYDDIFEEVKNKNIKLKWYRLEMTPLNQDAVVVVLYGETYED